MLKVTSHNPSISPTYLLYLNSNKNRQNFVNKIVHKQTAVHQWTIPCTLLHSHSNWRLVALNFRPYGNTIVFQARLSSASAATARARHATTLGTLLCFYDLLFRSSEYVTLTKQEQNFSQVKTLILSKRRTLEILGRGIRISKPVTILRISRIRTFHKGRRGQSVVINLAMWRL
jgi:hypothetical protein